MAAIKGLRDDIMKTAAEILAQVQAETTVEKGIETSVAALVEIAADTKTKLAEAIAKLNAQGADTTDLQAISDALDSNDSILNTAASDLAAAISSNTPAAAPPSGGDTQPAPDATTQGGGNADDLINGDAGDDSVQGADTQVEAAAGAGDDSLNAGAGSDTVTTISLSPSSLSTGVGTPISGQIAASEGDSAGPFTFALSEIVAGISISQGGVYSVPANEPMNATLNLTVVNTENGHTQAFNFPVSVA